MAAKPQISIAFPRQVAVPDDVLSVVERLIAFFLGGGGTTPPPAPGPPLQGGPPIALPEPVQGDAQLLTAIDDLTADEHVRLAMRLGALLEGGNFSGPWNAGDNGRSFGPYQIYTVAHPQVSRAEAENPQFAAEFMLPSYEAAAAGVDPSLWRSDPQQATALTVFHAERPAAMYPQQRINWAWLQVTTQPQE